MKNQLILFPCKNDKSPDTKGESWQVFNQSSFDTALLRLREGTGLVGLVVPNGFWLLDIDSYKPNAATLEQIEAKLGCSLEWEKALVQTTRGGGEHFLFRLPENINGASLPSKTNVLGLPSVDSKSSGKGYIATGENYRAHGVFEQLQTGSLVGESLPILPEKAIETLLKSCSGGDDRATSVEAECGIDEMSLVEWLNALPDSNFVDYTSWIDTLFACHHATGGARWGMEVFDSISRDKGGDAYTGKDDIAKRWSTASRSGAAGAKTFATIAAKVKQANPAEFEKLVAERKQVTVINSFDIIDASELDEAEADEGVSSSGHVYSECFKKLSRRREFTLKMNSHVCEAQSRDDFTYINISESGAAEKIRGLALRAAAVKMKDFEIHSCEDDVFEMINDFNALYDGDVVFGILPEFLRKIFLRSDKGSSKIGIFHQRLDARWEIVSEEVFNSNTRQHYSFSAFTYGVKRFNPLATKTWRPTPFWVARDFYRVPMLTGETYEMFEPKVISCDKQDMNKKLNLFEPYRALTLCRNVKTGAHLDRNARLGIMEQPEVKEAWHVFQQFVFQLVGADIRRIGYPELKDDGRRGVYGGQVGMGVAGMAAEREEWARLLISSMASTVQKPDVRRDWALLLKGAQGVGKSSLTRVLQGVLNDFVMNVNTHGIVDWSGYMGMQSGTKSGGGGGGGGGAVYEANLSTVLGRFNMALRAKLVCVIEELAMDEKIDTADRLKEILTSGSIRLEGKGVDVVVEKSYLNFYIFSNKKLPMVLGAERRFAVIETAVSDDAGSDAVLEYFAGIPFTHVDGRDFVSGDWGSGCVPQFCREMWVDNQDDDTLSDAGVIAQETHMRNVFVYKERYFEKLNTELIENQTALKALGAALALLDIKWYCPEFSLKNAFSSSAKNQMISLTTGDSSVGAGDAHRAAKTDNSIGLCDFVWGEKVVGEVLTTRVILKEVESGVLFGDSSLLKFPDEVVEAMRQGMISHSARKDFMADELIRKLTSLNEPMINLYAVDINELGKVIPKMHADKTSDSNHKAAIKHGLSALGYVAYLPFFKALGGNAKRGINVARRVDGSIRNHWVIPCDVYVFNARIDGVNYTFTKHDNAIVRKLFSASLR
mgnify:CR=1 FL=1